MSAGGITWSPRPSIGFGPIVCSRRSRPPWPQPTIKRRVVVCWPVTPWKRAGSPSTPSATRPDFASAGLNPSPPPAFAPAQKASAASTASPLDITRPQGSAEKKAGPEKSGPGLMSPPGQGSGGGGDRLAGVLELRQPTQPVRQVPVPVAEELHRRGQQHRADDRGVDQDGGREADAHLLHVEDRQRREDQGHADHHHP